MIDKLRHADRNRLAVIGIGLAIVFFFALNLLADLGLTSTRLDLTEDRLFTLSEGTKETLGAIGEPIHIRFYYSDELDEIGPYFTQHAARIEELLAEYQRLSDGMVRIERLDPEPFSHAEDLAVAEGLRGLPLGPEGTQAYFGLSGRNATDDLEVIPYLAPERGDFLEYDLTRLVYDLAHPEKPVVAVLGDLPLMGAPPRAEPWTVLETMFQFFDVRFLGGSHDEIADEVDLLMLAQPQQLDEKSLYAVDQFVMRGGRVLALIDPFAEVMQAGGNPMAGQGNPVEVMAPLLEAWGIEMPGDRVVGDAVNAQRVRAQVRGREQVARYLPWLTLDKDQLPDDDVITADLERITLATAGWIEAREDAGITIEPLLTSSPQAAPIEVEKVEGQPDPAALLEGFEPRGEPFVLAARVSGEVTSAFAEGPPEGVDEEIAERHLGEPQAPLNLILIADADFLADRHWLRQQNLLGQQFTVPIAHNGDFVVNALDNLAGGEALIALRGRGLSVRPFEVIEAMERAAEEQYRAKEEELLARIEETEAKIEELQREEQAGGVILTAEQQAAIEDFRARMLTLRQELREVQRSLREDVESLSFWVKALNIFAVPVLIAVLATALALIRRTRAARFAHEH